MSSDLRDLYQEVILDHSKRPRNFHTLEGANRQAEGYNPLCGDRVKIHLKLDAADRIDDIAFEGKGCAISQASAPTRSPSRGVPCAPASVRNQPATPRARQTTSVPAAATAPATVARTTSGRRCRRSRPRRQQAERARWRSGRRC